MIANPPTRIRHPRRNPSRTIAALIMKAASLRIAATKTLKVKAAMTNLSTGQRVTEVSLNAVETERKGVIIVLIDVQTVIGAHQNVNHADDTGIVAMTSTGDVVLIDTKKRVENGVMNNRSLIKLLREVELLRGAGDTAGSAVGKGVLRNHVGGLLKEVELGAVSGADEHAAEAIAEIGAPSEVMRGDGVVAVIGVEVGVGIGVMRGNIEGVAREVWREDAVPSMSENGHATAETGVGTGVGPGAQREVAGEVEIEKVERGSLIGFMITALRAERAWTEAEVAALTGPGRTAEVGVQIAA